MTCLTEYVVTIWISCWIWC